MKNISQIHVRILLFLALFCSAHLGFADRQSYEDHLQKVAPAPEKIEHRLSEEPKPILDIKVKGQPIPIKSIQEKREEERSRTCSSESDKNNCIQRGSTTDTQQTIFFYP